MNQHDGQTLIMATACLFMFAMQAMSLWKKWKLRRAWTDCLGTVREQLGREFGADSNWSISQNGKALMTLPKSAARRMLMLNHWYHHRGQLTVYLRLLDVAVPSIYGPSADENPFVGA